MKRALISIDKVAQVELVDIPVAPPLFWVDCPDDCIPGWLWNDVDGPHPKSTPIPTRDETIAKYNASLRDSFAIEADNRGYRSELEFVSFYNSTNASYAADTLQYVAWRDDCWAYAIQVLVDVDAGTIPLPTVAEFAAGIPVYPA